MSLSTARSLSLRLSNFLGWCFLSLGAYLPFWPVFLAGKELSAAEIGLVMGAAQWMRLIGVPFWGRIADPPGRGRPTLMLLALASAATYSLFFFVGGYAWALFAHLLLGFVLGPLVPISDSQINQATRDHGVDYGRVRLWGSATFVLGNLLGGWLIALENPDWYLLSVAFPILVTAAAAWTLPRRPPPPPAPTPRPASGQDERWRALFRNRPFLALVLVSALLQASHAAYYVVSALEWRREGYDDQAIAWLWVEGVLAEIVLLAYGRRMLRRFSPAQLLAIGGVGGLVRWGLMATGPGLVPLLLLQLLHALSFAVVHLAAVTLVARVVPQSRLSSGQSLLAAIQTGIFMSFAMALAGRLYEDHGAWAAYGAMAASCLLGLIALWRFRGLFGR